MNTRIEWSEGAGATHGLVGTVQKRLFKITPPVGRSNHPRYRLETGLPILTR